VILVGSARIEDARKVFASVEPVADLDNPYAIPNENRPILLARGLKMNLEQLWPRLKDWD
jgi:hypothetical protein